MCAHMQVPSMGPAQAKAGLRLKAALVPAALGRRPAQARVHLRYTYVRTRMQVQLNTSVYLLIFLSPPLSLSLSVRACISVALNFQTCSQPTQVFARPKHQNKHKPNRIPNDTEQHPATRRKRTLHKLEHLRKTCTDQINKPKQVFGKLNTKTFMLNPDLR